MRVELDRDGLEQIATSPEVLALVTSLAEDIARRANAQLRGAREDGYHVQADRRAGRRLPRARAAVIAGSPHARRHDAKHNTLVRVVGSL